MSNERAVKNTFIYFGGQLLSWTATIVTVSIIPRRLGETAMGQITIATVAVSTVATALAFGIEQFLTTEVGRGNTQQERMVQATLGLRLVLLPLMVLASACTLYVMHASPVVWILGSLAMLGAVYGWTIGLTRCVLSGWEDAKLVATSDLLSAFVPLIAIPFLIYGPIGLSLVNLLAVLPIGVFMVYRVSKGIRFKPIIDVEMWKVLLRGSFGFMVNDIVTPFYAFTSVFLLKQFTGEASVGVYAQSQKLLGTFMFIPTAIGAALLPSLARLADSDSEEFARMQKRVLNILIVLGLPIMVFAFMLATPFCQLLYGKAQFKALPAAVQACGLCVLPLYITTILYRFLVAQRKNGLWVYFMLGTIALNAVLCCVLIPWTQHLTPLRNGTVGAVIASAIAESCSVFFAFMLLKNNPIDREAVGRILRALLATLGMVAVMWLTHAMFFVFTAIFGLTVFGLLAWSLKVLGAEDQQKLLYIVARKLKRQPEG